MNHLDTDGIVHLKCFILMKQDSSAHVLIPYVKDASHSGRSEVPSLPSVRYELREDLDKIVYVTTEMSKKLKISPFKLAKIS